MIGPQHVDPLDISSDPCRMLDYLIMNKGGNIDINNLRFDEYRIEFYNDIDNHHRQGRKEYTNYNNSNEESEQGMEFADEILEISLNDSDDSDIEEEERSEEFDNLQLQNDQNEIMDVDYVNTHKCGSLPISGNNNVGLEINMKNRNLPFIVPDKKDQHQNINSHKSNITCGCSCTSSSLPSQPVSPLSNDLIARFYCFVLPLVGQQKLTKKHHVRVTVSYKLSLLVILFLILFTIHQFFHLFNTRYPLMLLLVSLILFALSIPTFLAKVSFPTLNSNRTSNKLTKRNSSSNRQFDQDKTQILIDNVHQGEFSLSDDEESEEDDEEINSSSQYKECHTCANHHQINLSSFDEQENRQRYRLMKAAEFAAERKEWKPMIIEVIGNVGVWKQR